MDSEELGGNFVVAVEELGLTGLWTTIKDILEARLPLQNLTFTNKVGQTVPVEKLPVTYVLSTDKRLLRLKPFSHSPVTWFRNPYAHIILVSTADANEYRSTVKNQIKKVTADVERDWGGPLVTSEWLILYVRPFELDIADKGAKRVFDKLRDDFSTRKRERVMRLDIPLRAFDASGRRVTAFGLEECDACLRDCVRASFETRQLAYDEEVKKLLNDRLEPTWSFTTLYLVKDSFALMLEYAGLQEDALKEYIELETCYLETLERGLAPTADFGAGGPGDDLATLLGASWRAVRRSVLKKNGVPEFQFRQYLFAAQARVMLKLGRAVEVAERGLRFVQGFLHLLAVKEAAGHVRPLFKECWTFSACMALTNTITTFLFRSEGLAPDWDIADILNAAQQPGGGGGDRGSTGGAGGRVSSGAVRKLMFGRGPAGAAAAATAAVGEDMRSMSGRASYATKHRRSSSAGSDDMEGGVDWSLGLPLEAEPPPLDLTLLAGQAVSPENQHALRYNVDQRSRELLEKLPYCLLGHLYNTARSVLLQLGKALKLQQQQSQLHVQLQQQQQQQKVPAASSAKSGAALSSSHGPPSATATATAAPLAALSPVLQAHFQSLLSTPLCGFSQMVAKSADGAEEPEYDVMVEEAHQQQQQEQKQLQPVGSHHSDTSVESLPHQPAGKASLLERLSGKLPSLTGSPIGSSGNLAALITSATAGGTGSFVSRLSRTSGHDGDAASSDGGVGSSSFGTGGGTELLRPAEREPSTASSISRRDSYTNMSSVSFGNAGEAPDADDGKAARGNGTLPPARAPQRPTADISALDLAHPSNGARPTPTGGLLAMPPTHSRSNSDTTADGSSGAFGQQQQQQQRGPSLESPSASGGSAQRSPAAGAPGGPGYPSPRQIESSINGPSAGTAAGGRLSPGPLQPSHQQPAPAVRTAIVGRPPVAPPQAALAEANYKVGEWVSEWRLKLALQDAGLFEDLVLELSLLAASCYSKCGRVRTSALIYADVAVLLLQRAQVDAACSLLERMMHILASENWHLLLGRLLPRLVACQRLVNHVMLPYTCVRMLGLPSQVCSRADRLAVFEELMACLNGGGSSSGGSSGKTEAAAAPVASIQLQALSALQVFLPAGSYSRFFGGDDQSGDPILVPPATSPATSGDGKHSGGDMATAPLRSGSHWGAAALLTVGDTLALAVDVHNNLPQPVRLEAVALVLGQLHKQAWLYTGTFNSVPSFGSAASSSSFTGTSSERRYASPGAPSSSGEPAAPRVRPVAGESPRITVQRWQEGEELTCTTIVAAVGMGAGQAGSAGGGNSSSSSSVQGSVVTLAPGVTRLLFRAVPLKEGIYVVKHLSARLGSCSLRINAVSQQQVQLQRERLPAATLPAAATALSQLGQVTPAGEVQEEMIVMKVESPCRRLTVAPVAAHGSLLRNQAQWLGLLLQPMHDVLDRARLQLQPRQNLTLRSTEAGASVGDGDVSESRRSSVDGGSATHAVIMSLDEPLHEDEDDKVEQPDQQRTSGQTVHLAASTSGRSLDPGQRPSAGRPLTVALQRGTVELSQHLGGAVTSPLLIWLQVQTSHVSDPPEVVKVIIPGVGGGTPTKRTGDPTSAGATATLHPVGPVAELDLNVEYFAGCWRSHATVLSVPLRPPFQVAAVAHALPNERIALQLRLTCDVTFAARVGTATVAPQAGLRVVTNVAETAGVLPVVLQPGTAVALTFILERSSHGDRSLASFDDAQNSCLEVEYQVLQPVAGVQAVAQQIVGSGAVAASGSKLQLPQPPHLPAPPAASEDVFYEAPVRALSSSNMLSSMSTFRSTIRRPGATAGGAASALVFQHNFLLEHPHMAQQDQQLDIRLLGPLTARLRESVSLAWQVTRRAPAAAVAGADGDDEMLGYEIVDLDNKGNWSASQQGRGTVRLGRAAGSMATVEAVVLPLHTGRYAAPNLVMRGSKPPPQQLDHQEAPEGSVIYVYP